MSQQQQQQFFIEDVYNNKKKRISTKECTDVANMYEFGTVLLKKKDDDDWRSSYFVDFNTSTWYWQIRKVEFGTGDSSLILDYRGLRSLEKLCDLLNKEFDVRYRDE